jgi:hypothetical protein
VKGGIHIKAQSELVFPKVAEARKVEGAVPRIHDKGRISYMVREVAQVAKF